MSKGPRVAIRVAVAMLSLASMLLETPAHAAPRKVHVVGLGATKRVPYSKAGDPGGAGSNEDALKIRPLLVDAVLKEWTTGDSHDVTDRSFVVRRAMRINDTLPGDKQSHWVWQRGPWLMVDRVTGRVTPLKLPDYDPGVSQVSWFRDYGAYCGVTASGKSLYAVVAQVAARKPVLAKKLAAFDAAKSPGSGLRCAPSGSASRCASPFIPPARMRSVSILFQGRRCWWRIRATRRRRRSRLRKRRQNNELASPTAVQERPDKVCNS